MMIRTALAALALLGAALTSTQAFAVTADLEVGPDAKPRCVFMAELGGYVCPTEAGGSSLTEGGDANGKKKFYVQLDPIQLNLGTIQVKVP